MFAKIYAFLVLVLILVLGTHAAALGGFLSYEIWWLDIVLHFVGGLWIAVFAFWFLFGYKSYPTDIVPAKVLFVGLISFAALAGVLWEFFEFSWDYFIAGPYGQIQAQRNLPDTMSDLFFDFLGALVASAFFSYYYFYGLRNFEKRSR